MNTFTKINKNAGVKLVVFDWAGTLIDFGCKAPVKAFKLAFNHFGLNPKEKIIRKYMGMSKYDHINAIINNLIEKRETKYIHVTAKEVYNVYEGMQISAIKQYSNIITGSVRMKEQLEDRNMIIGTTSGYSKEMLDCVLFSAKMQCFDTYFNMTPDMLSHNPARESGDLMRKIYNNVEKIYNVNLYNKVVKVGDTSVDMIEGKNAGAWNIACISSGNMIGKDENYVVNNIYSKNKHKTNKVFIQEYKTGIEELEKAGAHFIVHDINGVVDVIDNYINPLIERGYTPNSMVKSIVLI